MTFRALTTVAAVLLAGCQVPVSRPLATMPAVQGSGSAVPAAVTRAYQRAEAAELQRLQAHGDLTDPVRWPQPDVVRLPAGDRPIYLLTGYHRCRLPGAAGSGLAMITIAVTATGEESGTADILLAGAGSGAERLFVATDAGFVRWLPRTPQAITAVLGTLLPVQLRQIRERFPGYRFSAMLTLPGSVALNVSSAETLYFNAQACDGTSDTTVKAVRFWNVLRSDGSVVLTQQRVLEPGATPAVTILPPDAASR